MTSKNRSRCLSLRGRLKLLSSLLSAPPPFLIAYLHPRSHLASILLPTIHLPAPSCKRHIIIKNRDIASRLCSYSQWFKCAVWRLQCYLGWRKRLQMKSSAFKRERAVSERQTILFSPLKRIFLKPQSSFEFEISKFKFHGGEDMILPENTEQPPE